VEKKLDGDPHRWIKAYRLFLKVYSLIFIDNCLKKSIGPYKACSPLSNGNLIVTCFSAQQVKTLLSCTTLSDGTKAVEVVASSIRWS